MGQKAGNDPSSVLVRDRPFKRLDRRAHRSQAPEPVFSYRPSNHLLDTDKAAAPAQPPLSAHMFMMGAIKRTIFSRVRSENVRRLRMVSCGALLAFSCVLIAHAQADVAWYGVESIGDGPRCLAKDYWTVPKSHPYSSCPSHDHLHLSFSTSGHWQFCGPHTSPHVMQKARLIPSLINTQSPTSKAGSFIYTP